MGGGRLCPPPSEGPLTPRPPPPPVRPSLIRPHIQSFLLCRHLITPFDSRFLDTPRYESAVVPPSVKWTHYLVHTVAENPHHYGKPFWYCIPFSDITNLFSDISNSLSDYTKISLDKFNENSRSVKILILSHFRHFFNREWLTSAFNMLIKIIHELN